VERCRSELRSGLANIEAHYGPLATVLELCNETWMHTMLSEHPILWFWTEKKQTQFKPKQSQSRLAPRPALGV